jgi:hypothetical protein
VLQGYSIARHSWKVGTRVILQKACPSSLSITSTTTEDAVGGDAVGGDDAVGSSKAYGAAKKKARTTGVWLLKKPINHFIYRWSALPTASRLSLRTANVLCSILCCTAIYFAPHSQKDWAVLPPSVPSRTCLLYLRLPNVLSLRCSLRQSGHRFIEYVLAHDKLEKHERWVMEGLQAIRGSRNGVFFADAIAILIWRKRGMEFLQRQEDLAQAGEHRLNPRPSCPRRACLLTPL